MRNPFSPGAGSRPPLLVGRDAHSAEAMSVAVQRMDLGRFERSILLTGLRGVGKTVLLNEFGRIAEGNGWVHEHLEATEDTRVAGAVATLARRVLLELSLKERVKDRAHSALGALRTFVKVHVPTGDGGALTIDLELATGLADSGDLDGDLGGVFKEVGETAASWPDPGAPLTIDELQDPSRNELGVLDRRAPPGVAARSAAARCRRWPAIPPRPGRRGRVLPAERLFSYVEVDSLDRQTDAGRVLAEPVESEGAAWEADAVEQVIAHTEGYPYFLQEFGKQAWIFADGPNITVGDVNPSSLVMSIHQLDRGFFRARIDKTTETERDYLRAMAGLSGPGPYKSGDVSAALGKKTTQTGPVRDSLIKRGLLDAPRHGFIAFTVPMFDQFIRRTLG